MTSPDGIDALVNVNANDSLAAGGHAARHNSTNTALEEVRDWLAAPTQSVRASDYTFTADDVYRLTVMTGGSAVTIPPASSVDWDAGTQLAVLNQGSATVTVTAGSGVTLNGSGTALAQYAGGVAVRTGSDEFTFVPFSGAGAGSASPPSSVEYLVVAGGGGAAGGATTNRGGGGGGAGGYRTDNSFAVTASTSYTITVGGGGSGSSPTPNVSDQTQGVNSVFATVTATGGGRAGDKQVLAADAAGGSGGSGGGGTSVGSGGPAAGGAGNTPPTSPLQGNNGGTAGDSTGGGGGGGSGGAGGNATGAAAGTAGAGTANTISGTSVTYAAGGAGGANSGSANGASGTANSGNGGVGGGGGSTSSVSGGAGGSGVVIIRQDTAFKTATVTGSPTITVDSVNQKIVYIFNASGTIEWAA
jgi:hypothetical protein